MNPETECDCCPPLTCNVCKPQCSTVVNPYVRIRAGNPVLSELVCSTKNCNIFGGHDTNPMPEYEFCHKSHKKDDEDKNQLGSPIGLVVSNTNFKTENKLNDIIQVRYATYLKAFARLHLNEERTWDALLLDDLMKEGLNLYNISQEGTSNDETLSSEIYSENEIKVLREFELSGFKFHVELMPPFKPDSLNSNEVGANGDGLALTLEEFVPALKSFLRRCKYGLLTVGPFYAMIWHLKDAYFIFDTCGRRVSDFKSDKDKGVAMLICFKSLENVRHLIVNLSGLQLTQPLIIRELKVVKVVTPNGLIVQQDYGIRTHQYEIVNDDYAYIRAELHLSLNKKELLRNRSGLPVAVTAIVASKIDHPATWDTKLVDRIICFGVNFCQSYWRKCNVMDAIDVKEFPTYFVMAQFHVKIELLGHKYAGTWRCVPGFRHSELAHAIKKAFDSQHYKLVLQINHQMYAIWQKHDFIYLFDPYRHRILGKRNDSEVYEQMEKSGTVRMFRLFNVFMDVLNHILLDSNRTSQFFLHVVKVENIQEQHKSIRNAVGHFEEPNLDHNGEVVSLNEYICFEETEDRCKETLGEISDYEDEDLKSDVDELELKTSSSEEELLEEEGAAGEIEEMEGLETSSSGEEGSSYKKIKRGGSSRSKKAKDSASRSERTKKGGTSKGKKGGKGAKDGMDYDGHKKGRKRESFDTDDDIDYGTNLKKKGGKGAKDGTDYDGHKKGRKRESGDTDEDVGYGTSHKTKKRSRSESSQQDGRTKTRRSDETADERVPRYARKGGKKDLKGDDREDTIRTRRDESRTDDERDPRYARKGGKKDLKGDDREDTIKTRRDESRTDDERDPRYARKGGKKDLKGDDREDTIKTGRDESRTDDERDPRYARKGGKKDIKGDDRQDTIEMSSSGRGKEAKDISRKGLNQQKFDKKDKDQSRKKDALKDADNTLDQEQEEIAQGKENWKDTKANKDQGEDFDTTRKDFSKERRESKQISVNKRGEIWSKFAYARKGSPGKDKGQGRVETKGQELDTDGRSKELYQSRDRDLQKEHEKDRDKYKQYFLGKYQNAQPTRSDGEGIYEDFENVEDLTKTEAGGSGVSKDKNQTDKLSTGKGASERKHRNRDIDDFDDISGDEFIGKTEERDRYGDQSLSKDVSKDMKTLDEVWDSHAFEHPPGTEKDSDKANVERRLPESTEHDEKGRHRKERAEHYKDGTEADDENDELFKKKKRHCTVPNPNSYPGYTKAPVDMAVAGSESGSYISICKLVQAGFKVADRLLVMTPWGNFVLFRCIDKTLPIEEKNYFLFDGCTCNFDRFRHLDLSLGTAGLLCFKHVHNVIEYIRQLRKLRGNYTQGKLQNTAEDICKEYCNKSFSLCV